MVVPERPTEQSAPALATGARVRVLAEQGQPEASVVRVRDDYGVLTVAFEKPTKVERMYKIAEVKAL